MGKIMIRFCVGCLLMFLAAGALADELSSEGLLPKLKQAVRPQWENLQGLDIIPCPKQIEVLADSFPVDGNMAIVIGKAASDRTMVAARDFQKMVEEETSVILPVLVEGQATDQTHLILMGTVGEFPRLQLDCETAGISFDEVEQQGYAIFPVSKNGKQALALVGKDEQGVYWGAMTLSYLIRDGALQMVRILDWPDFKKRICETLARPAQRMFSAKTEAQKAAAWEAVEAGVREAARLKFNYVRCFAILYSNPKTDYILDHRAEVLGRIGAYANRRGLKLVLNFSGVVAAVGDEEQFPQLKETSRFLHLYTSWSDEELIGHACGKVTRMAKIIGPQVYEFHSPDMPGMGWSRRSALDRERWGGDRTAAESYLIGRLHEAVKEGSPGGESIYISNPYHIGKANDTPDYSTQLAIVKGLSDKMNPEIPLLWREGSVESVRRFRKESRDHPQAYYIENSSFHDNRLVGATARTAKTYYFENNDQDFFLDNSNTSTHPVYRPQNGILAEYAWNTQAPGSLFVHQSSGRDVHQKGKGMVVDGLEWQEWARTKDLEDPSIQNDLLPRVCRQLFGANTGAVMALAYGTGSSSNDRALGGLPSVPYVRRYANSQSISQQLAVASKELGALWGKKELFNKGTYSVYESAFKHVFVYQYVERVNACLMQLSWIAKTGENRDKIPQVVDAAFKAVEQAKTGLAEGYQKYHFQTVPYLAIYGAKIGDLEDSVQKITRLEDALKNKIKEIELLGAGNVEPEKDNTILGVAPIPAGFKLDGNIEKWDLAKAHFFDSSNCRTAKPSGVYGGNDIVAYWDVAWDSSGLYLAALVFDDQLMFSEDRVVYENDALEFWVNEDQIIVSLSSANSARVECIGNFDTDKLKVIARRGEGPHPLHPDMKYWTVELKMPMECVHEETSQPKGFYFALGVSDLDSGEKVSQCYFPGSYQYPRSFGASYLKDFAKVVLQSKAKLVTRIFLAEVKDIAKADGSFTCVDLRMALNTEELVSGISVDIVVSDYDGTYRFPVAAPVALKGEWMGTLLPQINTGHLFESNVGVDLIVRAPGYYKRIVLRDGVYNGTQSGEKRVPQGTALLAETRDDVILAGWDRADLLATSANHVAKGISASFVLSSTVNDTNDNGDWRAASTGSSDETFGVFPGASPDSRTGAFLSLVEGVYIDYTIINTGSVDYDLSAFRFDVYRKWGGSGVPSLQVLAGSDITEEPLVIGSVPAFNKTPEKSGNNYTDIDVDLSGLPDHTLAAGEQVTFRILINNLGGTLIDHVALTASPNKK